MRIDRSPVYQSYPADRIYTQVIYRFVVPDKFVNKTLRHCHSGWQDSTCTHCHHAFKCLSITLYLCSGEIIIEDTAATKKLKKFSLYPRKQINRSSHRNSYNYIYVQYDSEQSDYKQMVSIVRLFERLARFTPSGRVRVGWHSFFLLRRLGPNIYRLPPKNIRKMRHAQTCIWNFSNP